MIHHASVAVASALPFGGAVASWLVTAIGSAIVGVILVGVIAFMMHQIKHRRHKPADAGA